MSMQWHGGKGSKERTSNYNAYNDNMDKIFAKANKETIQWDVYGDDYETPNAVDLLEDDVIEWKQLTNTVQVKIVQECFAVGCASGRGGSVFEVPTEKFNTEYKPAFKCQ
jgi:hypothetical protein